MIKINFPRDQLYIRRIKQNDRSVLGEIFIQYEKMISSYVKSNGGNDSDADEVLQESIIVLWQKVCSGKLELTSKLSTYLMGVAKNKWMTELRKRRKFSGIEITENIENQELNSIEKMVQEERKALIQKALDELNPLCRKILILFYFEERNLDDITQIIKFANSDVTKSKKYQCKKVLKEILRKKMIEAEGRTP
jgi:RNA polymerase sigma factor (sigma-70 family)